MIELDAVINGYIHRTLCGDFSALNTPSPLDQTSLLETIMPAIARNTVTVPLRNALRHGRERRTLFAALVAGLTLVVLSVSVTPAAHSLDNSNGSSTAWAKGGGDYSVASSEPVSCDDAPEVFWLLCEAYELISSHHVDPVDDRRLAKAAAERVRNARFEKRTTGTPPPCPRPAPGFEELCAVLDAVEDTASAVEEAVRGMARSLDTNSYYLTTDQYRQFRMRLENSDTSGLGLTFGLADNGRPCSSVSETCRPVIAEVYPGSPADKAGLLPGDVLVKMGDRFPTGLGCEDISGLDSFLPGEKVAVSVRRGNKTISTTVTSAELKIPAARGRVVDNEIGHLRLDVFSSTADKAIAQVLDGLMYQSLSGLVLDLRGNGGGYIDPAVGAAGIFLPDLSVIVHLVSREKVETLHARDKEKAPDPTLLPMVVVVDGGTASAAEMVVGALGDQGRATVVGHTTFGKNTGQSSYQMEPDDTLVGVLHLTTLRWITPRSRSATGGFEPDVMMVLPSCLLPDEVARRAISAIRPRIEEVAITSEPRNDNRYEVGETVSVTATFSSPVVVDRNAAEPALKIEIGENHRPAIYASGSGSSRLTFEYKVRAEDSDPDGLKVVANSLRADPESITLQSGLDAILVHDQVEPDSKHRVGNASDKLSGSYFVDIADSPHRDNINRLAQAGITQGCGNNHYCPDQTITRAQIATLLTRALKLSDTTHDYFTDDTRTTHENSINRLAHTGITQGCGNNHYCPDQTITRAQIATLLTRALKLSDTTHDYFTDDTRTTHENSINRLAHTGITQGCGNNHYCPDQTITRAQVATFLVRLLDLLAPV